MVSSNCSNGAVIDGWRIKATKYTSSKNTGFASCAAASTPWAGLSSLGHLLCFIHKAQQEILEFLSQRPEFQGISKDSCVTAPQ